MLLAVVVPLVWLFGFVFAVAREDKLKITKYTYTTKGDLGFHLTGKAHDPVTNHTWQNLWLHTPRRSRYIKFRVTRWRGYDAP